MNGRTATRGDSVGAAESAERERVSAFCRCAVAGFATLLTRCRRVVRRAQAL